MIKKLENLSEEIYKIIEKNIAMSGVELMVECMSDKFDCDDVEQCLESLINEGRLIDLYPRNVNFHTAGIAETYYIAK